MTWEILVNAGSGKGLLPEGTEPLPESMFSDVLWGIVEFIRGQFHGHNGYIQPWYEFEYHKFNITTTSSKGSFAVYWPFTHWGSRTFRGAANIYI